MKQFAPIIIVFIVLAGAIGLFLSLNSSDSNNTATSQEEAAIRQEIQAAGGDVALIIGDADAPSTLVEYFDYKCPACNGFHQTTYKEIESAYINSGQTNIELRITPIIGPDSAHAGRGAYCANEQNAFLDYHNAVLAHMWDNFYEARDFSTEFQDYLTTTRLVTIVEDAGIMIDTQAFSDCIEGDKYNPFLDDNLLQAADDSIQGTPGFAIGEQSFVGGQPFSVFDQLIQIQLR